jgi:hypothetical protein
VVKNRPADKVRPRELAAESLYFPQLWSSDGLFGSKSIWTINVSTLSEVLRRRSCVLAESSVRSSSDRAVWRKPLVFTADAIMLWGLNRFSPATD